MISVLERVLTVVFLSLICELTALQSSSATLSVALYVYATERGELTVAFSVATILMILTLLLNFAANLASSKLGHKEN